MLKKKHKLKGIKPFDVINGAFLILFCVTIIVPFLHMFNVSISPEYVVLSRGLLWYAPEPIIGNYKIVAENPFIWSGYANTIFRTVVGTILQLFCTSMAAYAISKRTFPHKNFWTFFVVFTMFFGGGLIPNYLLINELDGFNHFWVLVIPGLVGAYNMVLMRNFFSALPEELEESAMMDGAGRFTMFFRIVLPCSKAILATIGLWLAVGHWNSWYDYMLYMRDTDKLGLQNVLRRIVLENSIQMLDPNLASLQEEAAATSTEGVKAAVIFVATIPIICVYPFLQKYFVKGVMVGSLKG